MYSTMIIAHDNAHVLGTHVVNGVLNAAALESVCLEVTRNHHAHLADFHTALGFTALRRHTDSLHFVDLDKGMSLQHQLPEDLFKASGIQH